MINKNKSKIKKLNIFLLSLLIMVIYLSACKLDLQAHSLKNPSSGEGYEFEPATWNYIYFGSYPQTEITSSKTIKAIENKLKEVGKSSGDVRVGRYRYRKVTTVRRQFVVGNTSVFKKVQENHYYRWEKIKWRVLKVDGNRARVLSDKALFPYEVAASSNSQNEWSTSSLRKYVNSDFYNTAFSVSEKKAIRTATLKNYYYTFGNGNVLKRVKTLATTKDKIFIPDALDLQNSRYGYGPGVGSGVKTHMNRTVKMTDYLNIDDEAYKSSADKTARYWLRTSCSDNRLFYCWNGRYQYNKEAGSHLCVVPALWLDLSNEKLYVKTTFNNSDKGKDIDGNDHFTIKYALNGGKNSGKNPKDYYAGDKVISLYRASRSGYEFAGWYLDKNCTKKISKIEITRTGNLTLYAKWKK